MRRENLDAVYNLYSSWYVTDRSDWAKARRVWIDTHDAGLALGYFPRQATLEISVLKQLKKNPTDFARAFGSVSHVTEMFQGQLYND